MIKIHNKQNCCGCGACVQKCPKECISLIEDEEGFLYPTVKLEKCIDCNLCEKVCPILNKEESQQPIKVLAAKNSNEKIRIESSSGGIFTLLAEETIKEGGVVFGACFDDKWEVKHDFIEKSKDIERFRGSKYVQSRIENNYKKAEVFLKEGRKVLFSGTPCQISGLKHYLRKEYSNLTTIDFVCHGVPSPLVWRKYLNETIYNIYKTNSDITKTINPNEITIEKISFREKSFGWKNFSFYIELSAKSKSGINKTIKHCEIYSKNIYMRGFLTDLFLRPSCYNCPCKSFKSGSDITIADLWGAQDIIPEYDDDKGLSLVILNTQKANETKKIISWVKEINYSSALRYNPSLENSVKCPTKKRLLFFKQIKNNKSIKKSIYYSITSNPFRRILSLITK